MPELHRKSKLLHKLHGSHGSAARTAPPQGRRLGQGLDVDVEELAPAPRCLQHDAVHTMRTTSGFRRKYVESAQDYKLRRMIEKQQQARNMGEVEERKRNIQYAKKEILEANSSPELFERAKNLIEEDWLGKIEAMPGNMFSIGAFGNLVKNVGSFNLRGLKATARLIGCLVIALIQLIGPPTVFFSTVFAWGVEKDQRYKWENFTTGNCFADWSTRPCTKLLGTMFLICFLMNSTFVLMDEKQGWFKIYNIFRYLHRSTPNFDLTGSSFLYAGAFINSWTVLWSCVSSYVIVGASDSPQDVLFDSLGLLFLYNLDDIGGELGFVDEDDWPGEKLGWIFQEMVKKDWKIDDAEEGTGISMVPCVKNCGRPAAPGYDTCCRGCAKGKIHDADCMGGDEVAMAEAQEEDWLISEREDWNPCGYVCLAFFHVTIFLVAVMTFVFPFLAAVTPFSLIAPENN